VDTGAKDRLPPQLGRTAEFCQTASLAQAVLFFRT
jgi:hypothetical protein